MRIAFDYQTFVWQSYGGISRYFTRMTEELMRLGEQVEIFAPLHRNKYLLTLPKNVVRGYHLNRYPPKMMWFFMRYNHIIAKRNIASWKPDLVHETYYSKSSTAPPGCRTVITVYDMIHELFSHEFGANNNMAEIKRLSIQRADHVICISENTKQDLMRLLSIPENKISVVLLGFDKFVAPPLNPVIPPAAIKPFVLYVGLRGGYKNFSGFLKAFATSSQLMQTFDIVTVGGGQLSQSEQMQIQALGFKPKQVKQVDGGDALLGQLYSTAHAFVYPSLYEGFGIPPLEAMAHYCPVVSSNSSSMPEVIGNAAEFFNPTDIDEMRHAIERVVFSESRGHELCELGVARLAEFTWAKCADETLSVYRSLVDDAK